MFRWKTKKKENYMTALLLGPKDKLVLGSSENSLFPKHLQMSKSSLVWGERGAARHPVNPSRTEQNCGFGGVCV